MPPEAQVSMQKQLRGLMERESTHTPPQQWGLMEREHAHTTTAVGVHGERARTHHHSSGG